MMMRTKLTLAFLSVAFVLLGVIGLGTVQGIRENAALERAEDDREELDDINDLTNGLYEEHTLAMKYMVTEDPDEADAILEERGSLSEQNEELYEKICDEFEGEDEHLEALEAVGEDMAAIDSAFALIVEQRTAHQPGISTWMQQLDEVYNDILVGDGPDDGYGLDHITAEVEGGKEGSEEEAAAAKKLSESVQLVGAALSLGLAIGLGAVMGRVITRPVVQMTEAAKKVREGDLEVSVEETGTDEMAELGEAFNQMVLSVRLVSAELDSQELTEMKAVSGSRKMMAGEKKTAERRRP